RYVETGHLLFVQRGTLYAAPFDVARPMEIGQSTPVVEGIRRFPGIGMTPQYDISSNGTLVYIPGPTRLSSGALSLVLSDRTGAVTPLPLPPKPYDHPRVSPDGKFLTYGTTDGSESNVWVYGLSRSGSASRLTTFGGHNRFPIWSGDGQRVAYQS